MATVALVMSGGGPKGAFTVGALKYIFKNRPEIDFDVIAGTSTGSLIAPLVATKEIDLLEKIYTTTETKDIVLKGNLGQRFLQENSLLDVSPLAQMVKDTFSPRFNAIMNANKNIYLSTVCLQTGKIVYFSTKHQDKVGSDYDIIKIQNQDDLLRSILASSDQPVFMPPIEVRQGAQPLRQYVDGGLREYAPIKIAIDSNATDIYAIILSPPGIKQKQQNFNSVPDILGRTISLFSEDVGVNDVAIPQLYSDGINYISALKSKVGQEAGWTAAKVDQVFAAVQGNPFEGQSSLNIRMIRPEQSLPSDGLEFVQAEMKQMLDLGFLAAQKLFEAPTFSPPV